MNRVGLIRILISAFIGACLAIVLLAFVNMLNAGGGFTLATVSTAAGWTIPLIAGLMSAALAWVLLNGPRAIKGETAPSCRRTCPMCGGSVRRDWRLCPHCGELLG